MGLLFKEKAETRRFTASWRFFNFYIFYFRFLRKYIFDMEIYRNIPGRPAAGRQGLFHKKNTKNNYR